MFLRDGLQSLKPYPLATKINMFDIINKNNFDCIEFGSTTNSRLLPQMANSIDLWYDIKSKMNVNKHYTMLTPSKIDLLITKDLKSFGLLTSVCDKFSQLNLNKSVSDSFINLLDQINKLNNLNNSHIRVYVSCVFGEIPDGKITPVIIDKLNTLLEMLKIKINELNLKPENLDIVLCDTIGNADHNDINHVLKYIDKDLIDYYALHLHSDSNFYSLIDVGLLYNICKYDSSLLGIGGCPFAKKKCVGNISTYELVKYLHDNNYKTNLDLELLKDTENKLQLLIG